MRNSFFKSVKKAIKHWYIPLLIGLFFIVVGIMITVWPEGSFKTFAILFSLSFLLSGLAEVIFCISNRDQLDNWGWPLAFGLATAIMGTIMLTNPALSMVTLALFVGFIFLFRSIGSISYSIELKNYGVKNWGWMLALGIISTILSIILIINPLIAGLSLVVLVALDFILIGFMNIFLSIQLKKLHKSSKRLSEDLQSRYDSLMEEIRDEWDD